MPRPAIYPLLAAVVVLLVVAAALADTEKSPVGAVVSWTGEVYVDHKGKEEMVEVRGLEGIYEEDLVITMAGARAKLLFKDDTILSIGEGSRIRISGYTLLKKKSARIAKLKIFVGKFRVIVSRFINPRKSKFYIETKTAIIGVKGTDFIVDASSASSEIITLKGLVGVRSLAGDITAEVVLKPGLTTTVAKGAAPTSPVKVSPERLAELIEGTSIPVTVPIEQRQSGCIACHKNVGKEATGAKSRHPGFLQLCDRCHIKSMKKTIKIPVKYYSSDTVFFLDVKDRINYRVMLKVKDPKGREAKAPAIEFKPVAVTNTKRPEKTPPVISRLRLLSVGGGVFSTVVMAWETDEPASSMIEYSVRGKKEIESVSVAEGIYSVEHKVGLRGLDADRKYSIRAVSKDVFGNRAVSKPLIVKTGKPFAAEVTAPLNAPVVKSFNVVRIGKRTALSWSTNVITEAEIEIGALISGKGGATAEEPHYPGLARLMYTGMDGCLGSKCHKGRIHKETSHPLGKVEWYDIRRPKGMPLADANKIICSTCHKPHVSRFPLMLRRKGTDLCTACHVDKR